MADVRLPQGDISTWDEDNAGDEIPQRVGPMEELGVTGVKRVSGLHRRGVPAGAPRAARRSGSTGRCRPTTRWSGRCCSASTSCSARWSGRCSRPSSPTQGIKAQEFLESCMEDMSHTWDDFIGEVLSHDHLRLELARDRLQEAAGPLAEGPQEAVQAHRRADRLAQDADPRAGDAAALVLRRDRRDQGDGADGPAAVPDHGDPDREERSCSAPRIAKGNPEGLSPAPHRLPLLVLQEAPGGVRGDRCRARPGRACRWARCPRTT